MTTIYALLTQACGLSQREAAELFEVRHDTARAWSSGKHDAPERVIEELRELDSQIERATVEALAEIERGDPSEIVLAQSNKEAQALGLPCVGAHRELLSRVVSRCPRPLKITA